MRKIMLFFLPFAAVVCLAIPCFGGLYPIVNGLPGDWIPVNDGQIGWMGGLQGTDTIEASVSDDRFNISNVWAANDSIWLMLRMDSWKGVMPSDKDTWNAGVYLDWDANAATGYTGADARVGADLIFRYDGNGSYLMYLYQSITSTWVLINVFPHAFSDEVLEVKFDRWQLNNYWGASDRLGLLFWLDSKPFLLNSGDHDDTFFMMYQYDSPNSVPEPATMLLLGLGLMGLAGMRRKFQS